MIDPTRRGFLAVSGVGAAAVAAAALAPSAEAIESAASAPSSDLGSTDGPLVAYVDDVASGRITLVAGDSRAVVTDRALATSLARKVGRS